VPVPSDPQAVSPGAANPLAGQPLFVDAVEPSWKHWRSFRNRGKKGSAARIWTIARQPKFRWFGRFTHNVTKTLRAYTARARRKGAVPLITSMRHQGKECPPATRPEVGPRTRGRASGIASSPAPSAGGA